VQKPYCNVADGSLVFDSRTMMFDYVAKDAVQAYSDRVASPPTGSPINRETFRTRCICTECKPGQLVLGAIANASVVDSAGNVHTVTDDSVLGELSSVAVTDDQQVTDSMVTSPAIPATVDARTLELRPDPRAEEL